MKSYEEDLKHALVLQAHVIATHISHLVSETDQPDSKHTVHM